MPSCPARAGRVSAASLFGAMVPPAEWRVLSRMTHVRSDELRTGAVCYTAPGMGRTRGGAREPCPDGYRRPGRWVRSSTRVWSVRVPGGARSRPVLPGSPPSSPLPSQRGRGGSCLRERRSCQASATPYPKKPDAAMIAATPGKRPGGARLPYRSGPPPPPRAKAMSMQIPDLQTAFASVRAGVPAGSAARSAAADPEGMSAVMSARSA